MIVEQNISIWIQIAPTLPDSSTSTAKNDSCTIFPLEYFSDSASLYSEGVSNFQVVKDPSLPYILYKYTLTANLKTVNGKVTTSFSAQSKTSALTKAIIENSSSEGVAVARTTAESEAELSDVEVSTKQVKIQVDHYWYFNWEDFRPPPIHDTQVR